ncbi:MAG: hypothetical protein FJ276_37920, partial [Planctomycetes bacterium]|nr:hypothetical protein [Planctomycetota bacterium]
MNAHFGFTVVIATFNRPRRLEGTMAAVRAAVEAAGGGHRLVVVDNGAAEPAEEAVARFARDGGFP